ncbi:hypothetical protein ABIE49_002627 [Bradyrhizobium sp. OAE829]
MTVAQHLYAWAAGIAPDQGNTTPSKRPYSNRAALAFEGVLIYKRARCQTKRPQPWPMAAAPSKCPPAQKLTIRYGLSRVLIWKCECPNQDSTGLRGPAGENAF